MTSYDLKNLKLIAQGAEAEIYDIGEDKILRVLRKSGGMTFESYKALFSLLHNENINMPYIYECIEVDGRPAEIMQKISGETMLKKLVHQPFKSMSTIKRMAHMHFGIFNIEADPVLPKLKEWVDYFSKKEPLFDKQLIDFALKLFNELPESNQLCHGDFHPGNILTQNGEYYIIDWSGAHSGNYLSDVAHTYLLMGLVPEVPGQSRLKHLLISFTGALLAKVYLKEIYKLKSFDRATFSKWTVVMAFLRVYYGLPSEKAGRIAYIRKCYELNFQNVNPVLWYKKI